MTTDRVLEGLDASRRVAWAKFYELARLVVSEDWTGARAAALAVLRDDDGVCHQTENDLSEYHLGGQAWSGPVTWAGCRGQADPVVVARAIEEVRAVLASSRGGAA